MGSGDDFAKLTSHCGQNVCGNGAENSRGASVNVSRVYADCFFDHDLGNGLDEGGGEAF